MDFLSMAAFSLMGLDALRQLGGFEAITSLRNAEGKLLSIGAERSYFYNAAAQRICLFQVAYEAKNFCDSVIHNDGVLFLVHHTVTGLLSVTDSISSKLFESVLKFVNVLKLSGIWLLSRFPPLRDFLFGDQRDFDVGAVCARLL